MREIGLIIDQAWIKTTSDHPIGELLTSGQEITPEIIKMVYAYGFLDGSNYELDRQMKELK